MPPMPGCPAMVCLQTMRGIKASVTICTVMAFFMDQPTMRRESRSMTTATCSQPSAFQS